MDGTVYVKRFAAPPWDRREILRYAGAKETSDEVNALLEHRLTEAEEALSYHVCYAIFPVVAADGALDLGFARTDSTHLCKNLQGCDRIAVFGATVGLGIDRLIARYSRTSPARALMFQAIGAERIESLCDAFCRELNGDVEGEGKKLRPRFSPGYGDLPLKLQLDIFRVLDCPRKIGLTLNDSLLMSPSKSVTAVVGIGDDSDSHDKPGCSKCKKADCLYRRNV
jgi:5-methyltetrahydrofolate--homocysteine methyltransferase